MDNQQPSSFKMEKVQRLSKSHIYLWKRVEYMRQFVNWKRLAQYLIYLCKINITWNISFTVFTIKYLKNII